MEENLQWQLLLRSKRRSHGYFMNVLSHKQSNIGVVVGSLDNLIIDRDTMFCFTCPLSRCLPSVWTIQSVNSNEIIECQTAAVYRIDRIARPFEAKLGLDFVLQKRAGKKWVSAFDRSIDCLISSLGAKAARQIYRQTDHELMVILSGFVVPNLLQNSFVLGHVVAHVCQVVRMGTT